MSKHIGLYRLRSSLTLALAGIFYSGPLPSFQVPQNNQFWDYSRVVKLGDLNGDGVPEYALSGGRYSYEGVVNVYSGKTKKLLFAIHNVSTQSFGYAIADGGDLSKDGVPDLLVSAPGFAEFWVAGGYGPGSVFGFSGKDGSQLFEILGDQINDAFGYSVAGGQDINGDGYPDWIAGATGGSDEALGYVNVISGKDGSLLQKLVGTFPQASPIKDLFGHSVAALGDVDQDGVGDWAVGAPWLSVSGKDNFTGGFSVHSGKTGAVLFFKIGDLYKDELGFMVSSVGDLNGDGVPDVLASAIQMAGQGHGFVRAYSGKDGSAIFDTAQPAKSFLPPANWCFGASLAPAGDVNGDGVPDVIASSLDLGIDFLPKNYAMAISGKDGSPIFAVMDPLGYSDSFGQSVVGFDMNQDGLSEILVAGGEINLLAIYPGGSGSFVEYGEDNNCPGFQSFAILKAVGGLQAGDSLLLQTGSGEPNVKNLLLVVGMQRDHVALPGSCSMLFVSSIVNIASIPLSSRFDIPPGIPKGAQIDLQAFYLGHDEGYVGSNGVELSFY